MLAPKKPLRPIQEKLQPPCFARSFKKCSKPEGMFEDFLLPLIPAAALTFARDAARTARVRGYGNYREAHESKAVAHTYPAWQDEPGKPLGIAIRGGIFDLTNPAAAYFIRRLQDLFRRLA